MLHKTIYKKQECQITVDIDSRRFDAGKFTITSKNETFFWMFLVLVSIDGNQFNSTPSLLLFKRRNPANQLSLGKFFPLQGFSTIPAGFLVGFLNNFFSSRIAVSISPPLHPHLPLDSHRLDFGSHHKWHLVWVLHPLKTNIDIQNMPCL